MTDEVIETPVIDNAVQQKKQGSKTPLTESELFEAWKGDEYWNQGGSYTSDPYTGKLTPKED
jgi:hypothetical protein